MILVIDENLSHGTEISIKDVLKQKLGNTQFLGSYCLLNSIAFHCSGFIDSVSGLPINLGN